jgi:Xaa-Pro aminopeptidase
VELFQARRDRFLKSIAGGVAIFASPAQSLRNGDVEHPFRQDSDLYYLTGFPEPETVAVFAPENAEHPFILFVRPRDKEREVWTGRRAGVEGATERFGAAAAFPTTELEQRLPDLLLAAETLYYDVGGHNPGMDQKVLAALRTARSRRRRGAVAPRRIEEPHPLHELRLIKSEPELARLRRAAAITAEAHVEAMRQSRPGMHEYEVETLINHIFRKRGAAGPGYNTIVGAGDNATVLHYTNNDAALRAGELLLIDAGAEYDYYTADVTRTFPVGARFSGAQRAAYEMVLDAQLAAVGACTPGTTFDDVHKVAVRRLTEGMVDLGLLKGSIDELIEKKEYEKFYMHRTGHWLGMDVHDVGAYRDSDGSRKLQRGMVLTVEPGLYVARDGEVEVPEALRGIGVRIEDDVLVTDGAPEVLTRDVPKRTADVEALTAG